MGRKWGAGAARHLWGLVGLDLDVQGQCRLQGATLLPSPPPAAVVAALRPIHEWKG